MKKIILTLLVIASAVTGYSQVPTGVPLPFGSKYTQFKGYVLIDSALLLTARDTTVIPIKPALVFRDQDSSLYFFDRLSWHKITVGAPVFDETDPTVSDTVKGITAADTSAWHGADRKKIVSMLFDSASKVLSLTLNDGTVLSDTINIAGGSGTIDLTASTTSTTVRISPSNGAFATIPSATYIDAGVLSAADKLKYDSKYDSVAIANDSVLVKYRDGNIVDRDTVRSSGGVAGSYSPGYGIIISGSTIKGDTAALSLLYRVTASTVNDSTVQIIQYGDTTTLTIRGGLGAGGSAADGSETKVTAGAGISVTGTGTTGTPYVVTATGSVAVTDTSMINVKGWLTGLASDLISQSTLNTIFDSAVASGKTVYFPNGTYVFPYNFTYNFNFSACRIMGEDPQRTIITTRYGSNTDKIVERVDVTAPLTQPDGYYRIDVIANTFHPDWTNIFGDTLDQYIKIVDGIPSNATFAEIKAANYVTELDATQPDPGIDGKYVTARLNFRSTGGGYSHTPFAYDDSIPNLLSAYLQRNGGVWSRIDPANGFKVSGSLSMENIQFNDVSFYVFTPYNITQSFDGYIKLKDCIFKQLPRVCGLDREFIVTSSGNPSTGYNDIGGFRRGDLYHLKDGKRFNYNSITVENCEFSYIHTAIFWEMPPTKNLVVRNNYVHDCYTNIELFLYLPMSNFAPIDGEDVGYDDQTKITYTDNVIERVRHYDPNASGNTHIFRVNGNSIIRNNRIIDCDGNFFYLSGSNHLVDGNILRPFIDGYKGLESWDWGAPTGFHIKGSTDTHLEGVTISNNKILKSAWMLSIDIKNSNFPITIINNELRNIGWAEPLVTSDTAMERSLMYEVFDTTVFKTLAGAGQYDSSAVHANALVYWDIRRTKWMEFPSTIGRVFGILEKSQYPRAINFPVKFIGNDLYGYTLCHVTNGHVDEAEFRGNTIHTGNGLGFYAFNIPSIYLRNLRMSDNTIYWGTESFVGRTYNVNNIFADNNTIYYNQLQAPMVEFMDKCYWTNNNVLPWPKFADSTTNANLGSQSGAANVAVKFQPTGSAPELYITGGSFDSYLTRYGCIGWLGASTVSIDGTRFNNRLIKDISSVQTTRRFAMYFNTLTTTADVRLNNLTMNYENRTNRYLFACGGAAGNGITFTNLRTSNIQSVGSYPLTGVVYHDGAGSLTVTNFYAPNSTNLPYGSTFNTDAPTRNYDNKYTFALSANGSYVIPAGQLVDVIEVVPTVDLAGFKIGSTTTGSEYGTADLTASVANTIGVNIGAVADKTIYFSGITSGSVTITIHKR